MFPAAEPFGLRSWVLGLGAKKNRVGRANRAAPWGLGRWLRSYLTDFALRTGLSVCEPHHEFARP